MAVNEIPFPGITEVAAQRDTEILYSANGLQKHGGTFVQNATAGPNGDGVLPVGTVVGRVTASGKYAAYSDGNSPAGVGTALGILSLTIDVSDSDQIAPIYFAGHFKYDKIVGLDANGIADLKAKVDTVRNVLSFY